ncbi:MAG TPA: hypothetical protein VHZ98_11305 [Galbitalea sp.]|jgi:hypothetical protein|nr:hypothetical protein [Galbitalea sp.]
MMKFLASRIARSEREGGFALPLVLSISIVLALLMVTAISSSVSGLQTTYTDQDSTAALAAAYAGVDEYESRLAGDSSYGQYGNPNSVFTKATGSTVIAPLPAAPNPAFDVTKGGTWASVAGSNNTPGGPPTAFFRYEVDNSQFASTGVLRIRSTGKVGNTTRSVVASVRGTGFIDFLYFTDYEIADPALGPFNSSGNPLCVPAYGWQTPAPNRANCNEITFNGGDVLDGPVHSNDLMHICTAKFGGAVTSADPTAPYYSPTLGGTHAACTGQVWYTYQGQTYVPSQDSSIVMPTTNTNQLNETAINDPQDVPRPGCLYTGPTSITLTSDGNMRVISPYTQYTQTGAKGTPAAGVTLENCGTPGSTGLGAANGQVIPVPTNNLIYVQAVPGTTTDPNYSPSGSPKSPTESTVYPGCVGSNTNTTATSAHEKEVAGNGIGYPASLTVSGKLLNEAPPSSSSYGCTAGDAFVSGTLKGRLTIAAANYIYITGDINYADSDGDILGLVGQKAVWIWNPLLDNGNFLMAVSDRYVHAAILSLNDTFTVQNYDQGTVKRGTLYLTGAIAQKFRGAVATGSGSTTSTGYTKNYTYDQQLETAAPPKFLAPVSTTYGTTSMAQVAPAFTADGTAVALG